MYRIETDTWTVHILDGSVAPNDPSKNTDQDSFSKLPLEQRWPANIGHMISTFDTASRTVWVAYLQISSGKRIFLRKFNLISGLWTHVAVLEIPKEFWEQIQNFQSLCLTFVGQFLLVWAPLGDQALYVHYSSEHPILTWDNVYFEGTRTLRDHDFSRPTWRAEIHIFLLCRCSNDEFLDNTTL
jgi:hypothetical protein